MGEVIMQGSHFLMSLVMSSLREQLEDFSPGRGSACPEAASDGWVRAFTPSSLFLVFLLT